MKKIFLLFLFEAQKKCWAINDLFLFNAFICIKPAQLLLSPA